MLSVTLEEEKILYNTLFTTECVYKLGVEGVKYVAV